MITFKAKTASGEIINSALSPFRFPAGEAHVKRNEQREIEPVEIAIFQPNNFTFNDDLFQVAMWADYLKQTAPDTKTVLILPYLPAARADRGAPHGAKVYASFLNALKINQILVFDPHSEAAALELSASDQVRYLYPDDLFKQSHIRGLFKGYTGIIAPDKGAVQRAQSVATVLDLPLYTAEKTRDFETGKLSGFKLDGLPSNGRYLIVDDICDGGGTFRGLAAALGLPKEQIALYVSHGVFSSEVAINESPNFFEAIYTTNSYDPKTDLNEYFAFSFAYRPENASKRIENLIIPKPYIRVDVVRLLMDEIKY